jgi:hypothetical protein
VFNIAQWHGFLGSIHFYIMKHSFFLTTLSILSLAQDTIQQCSNEQPTVVAPHKNIWQPLSDEEILGVNSVLAQKLNVTSAPDGR